MRVLLQVGGILLLVALLDCQCPTRFRACTVQQDCLAGMVCQDGVCVKFIDGGERAVLADGDFRKESLREQAKEEQFEEQVDFLLNPPLKTGWIRSGGGDYVGIPSIFLDEKGNVYVAGSFKGTVKFGPFTLSAPSKQYNTFITKLNNDGKFLWALPLVGAGAIFGNPLVVDKTGNLYIAGFFEKSAQLGKISLSSSANRGSLFVAKLSPEGKVLWAISTTGESSYGEGVVLGYDGNIYVLGGFEKTVKFGTITLTSKGNVYPQDVFVAKLDSAGNFVWVVSAGGTENDFGRWIVSSSSGDLYITGEFYSRDLTFGKLSPEPLCSGYRCDLSIYVARLNRDGQFMGVLSTGTPGNPYKVRSITTDAANNVYLFGPMEAFGKFGEFSLHSNYYTNLYIAKIAPSLKEFLWANLLGGVGNSSAGAFTLGPLGFFYIASAFNKAEIGSKKFSSKGETDIFVAKIDSLGRPRWVLSTGGKGYNTGRGIAVDQSENLYVTGDFEQSVNFGGTTLTAKEKYNIFIWKIEKPD